MCSTGLMGRSHTNAGWLFLMSLCRPSTPLAVRSAASAWKANISCPSTSSAASAARHRQVPQTALCRTYRQTAQCAMASFARIRVLL